MYFLFYPFQHCTFETLALSALYRFMISDNLNLIIVKQYLKPWRILFYGAQPRVPPVMGF